MFLLPLYIRLSTKMIAMRNKLYSLQVAIIVVAGLYFSACSKSNDSPSGSGDFYIRFKVDGALVEYTDKKHSNETDYITAANSIFSNGQYLHILSGSKSIDDLIAKRNFMSVSLLTTKNITNGISFSSNAAISDNYLETIAFALGYNDATGTQYVAFGEDVADLVFNTNGTIIDTNNKVTFDEVGDDYVKGSFYGKVYADNFAKQKAITEGSFYLHLVK